MAGRKKPLTTVNRRAFVGSLGVAGIATLAGCSGGTAENEATSTIEDSTTKQNDAGDSNTTTVSRVDRPFRFVGDMVPSKMQFNPFNPNNFSARGAAILYDPLAKFRTSDGTFVPYLAEDWSIESERMSITLRSGQVWHDGEPITAADLAAQLTAERFLGRSISNYVGSVEVVDETTVRLSLPDAVNKTVLKHTVLKKRLTVPRHHFEAELNAIKEASSDAEKEDAKEAILTKKLDEAIGNSAFKLAETGSQQFRAVVTDDHPDADHINFTEFIGLHLPGQDTWQALKQGKLDGTPKGFIPDEVTETFPDTIVQKRFLGNVGYGLFFQHDDPVWSQRDVRRAIAHVIERPKVAMNSGGSLKNPIDVPTGIPGVSVDRNLGDVLDGYDAYETDHEKAAELLESAGFSKEGDTWMTPEGNQLSAPITTPAQFPDYMKASQTIVSQLQAFGIDAEVDSTEVTTFFGSVYPNSDFKLVTHFWGGFNPYPYFGLDAVLGGDKPHNFPATVDVPAQVGDPNSAPTSMDLPAKIAELSKSSGDSAKQLIQELTWAFNQTLPAIPIQEKYQQTFMTTDDWEIPNTDDPDMAIRWPVYWLWRAGKLKAKPT